MIEESYGFRKKIAQLVSKERAEIAVAQYHESVQDFGFGIHASTNSGGTRDSIL